MQTFEKTPRATVVRAPKRARYEREIIYAILDEALFSHIGFVDDGRPVVIPINHWRNDDKLYFHGSSASRLMRVLCDGQEVCVSAALLDGLVLGRSAFHHSVNYRSVVIFGRAEAIEDPVHKLATLEAFIEHLVPGRWPEIRQPTEIELKATAVAALPLEEASAKVRNGPPVDDNPDYALPIWAGEVPFVASVGEPVSRIRDWHPEFRFPRIFPTL